MPNEQIVALLVTERDKLSKAIEALQGPLKRRGRPPKNPISAEGVAPQKKRKARTAAQRRAQSERMTQYWASRRRPAKTKA